MVVSLAVRRSVRAVTACMPVTSLLGDWRLGVGADDGGSAPQIGLPCLGRPQPRTALDLLGAGQVALGALDHRGPSAAGLVRPFSKHGKAVTCSCGPRVGTLRTHQLLVNQQVERMQGGTAMRV